MPHNAFFAGTFDLTSLVFGSFVLFFVGLLIYLRREDRREGYPLEDEVTGRTEVLGGLFFTAQPKSFILDGGRATVLKPNSNRDSRDIAADRTSVAPGSPLKPRGDGMMAGIGPGAFAQRARTPDMMAHGGPKIVPLRVATDFSIAKGDPDPRGMSVTGADGVVAGVVGDVWVDKAEVMIRYLEVKLSATAQSVLLPMTMAVIHKGRGIVKVDAILASQFSGVPKLSSPNQVTLDEEERVVAYYGGGYLYATPARLEPLI
jgi:photosynthetic reaction center H subunit